MNHFSASASDSSVATWIRLCEQLTSAHLFKTYLHATSFTEVYTVKLSGKKPVQSGISPRHWNSLGCRRHQSQSGQQSKRPSCLQSGWILSGLCCCPLHGRSSEYPSKFVPGVATDANVPSKSQTSCVNARLRFHPCTQSQSYMRQSSSQVVKHAVM